MINVRDFALEKIFGTKTAKTAPKLNKATFVEKVKEVAKKTVKKTAKK